jgi:glycosyltransferase involved in cell wall biosynthesis
MEAAGRAVTIAVPVRNGAEYLGEALRSAVAQRAEWPETSIVVHDNASTDATPEIVAGFAGEGVRLLRYEESVSMADNWNRGLAAVETDFLVLLHADDLLLPGMVARAARVLLAAPDAAFAFGACRFVDAEGRTTMEHRPYERGGTVPRDVLLARHIRNNFIYCPTTMFRVAALRDTGVRFRPELKQLLDWDLLLRLQFAGWAAAYVPELQAHYRVHGGSATAANVAGGGIWDEAANVWEDLARLPDLPRWARLHLGVVFARLAARRAVAAMIGASQPSDASLPAAARALRSSAGHLGWRIIYRQPEQLAWATFDEVRRRYRGRSLRS